MQKLSLCYIYTRNKNIKGLQVFLNDYPYTIFVSFYSSKFNLLSKFNKYNPAFIIFKIIADNLVKRKIIEGWHYYQQHAISKNSKIFLITPTKYNTGQVTHPDILYFPN